MGGDLVKNSPSLRSLVPIIRHHHEFYDGSGYPDRLAGNQISIEARIVAIADAIDAMTSDRPYRKALKMEQVIEEINRHAGTQFDPRVAKEAIRLLKSTRVSENPLSDPVDSARQSLHLKMEAKPL
jgi:HD-GYP domain-containing protein (c-di-GMP phosphodiesterase class II)